MKSEIIAFACGRSSGTFGFKSNDCGPRGMLGGVASRFSSRKSHASATLPTPIALRARKRRRDQSPIAFEEKKAGFMNALSTNRRTTRQPKFIPFNAPSMIPAGLSILHLELPQRLHVEVNPKPRFARERNFAVDNL